MEQRLYLAGDTTDHVVLVDPDGTILGTAMLSRWGEQLFHLDVIGVRVSECGKGFGSILLGTLVRIPWEYCRKVYESASLNQEKPTQDNPLEQRKCIISTVARGTAQAFYRQHGFEACTFGDLPELYLGQCATCTDKGFCDPVAMIRR
ncbi:MAG: GNAT family N-acetyltransferase [Coriobacteriia bacterium]|nr:GNAT family N-acetyltransferase [Coriobacteriia bacterium]